jgi:isochorismate pyruvate lyase
MKEPSECRTIEDVREAIDAIDRDIIVSLGRRFEYVKAITRFKKTEAEVRANDRYEAVLRARREWAADAGFDPDVVEQLYRLMIEHFIAEEMKELGLIESGQT